MNRKKRFWFYVRSYRNKSLITKNFIIILIIFILPMTGMGLIVYQNMSKIVEREVSTISMASLLNTKDMVDTVLSDADTIATQISIHADVRVFFMSRQAYASQGLRYSEVANTIRSFQRIHRYIDTIYVYSNTSNTVLSTRDSGPFNSFADKSWYNTYLKKEGNLPWIQARKKNDIYPYYISVVRPAYLYDDAKLGAVLININTEELANIIGVRNDQNLKDIYIIDEEGTILFNYNWDNILKNIKDIPSFEDVSIDLVNGSKISVINNEKYIVSTVIDSKRNLKYISRISLQNYSERVEWVENFILFFLVISIILATFIAIFLSYKSFEPIRNIIHLIESPEDWEQPKKNPGMDELKYIANNIVKMVSVNKQLQDELESRLTLLDKAHTSALQAQINPHFLYNTLESINWLAALSMGKKNEVSEMISNLSKLLRLSLETDEEITTIGKEIEHARCYIDIMKIRHSDKFEVIWDIPQELLEYKIIKLCLQPIIENTLEHGLHQIQEVGQIRISAKIVESTIVIEARDNGRGLLEERIEEINRALQNDYILKAEHIGLRNIAQRIKIVFGEEYGILLRKGEPCGLLVSIVIPYIK